MIYIITLLKLLSRCHFLFRNEVLRKISLQLSYRNICEKEDCVKRKRILDKRSALAIKKNNNNILRDNASLNT